jgi:hypothetical protein
MNAWVEQYLRLWSTGRQNNWAKLLPIAEYAHNSWTHDTTRKTPHELLMGIKPSVNIELIEVNVPTSVNRLKHLEQARMEAQTQLERMQKKQDNKQTPEFAINNQVWLEGKNLQVRGQRKLLPRRYGPFKITAKIGPVAYRLDMPSSMKIHNVFHVDLLMPYKETEAYGTPFTRPPPEINNNEEEYEIEAIRDTRRYGRSRKLQYLVHWKGYPNSDDSWVDHKDLHAPELLKEFYTNSTKAGRTKV